MGYPIYHSQYTAAQIEASIGKTPRIKAATRTWEIWDISTSAYVDTGVSIDTELFVDSTLTEAGYAADAKVTGDKIGELKSAFNSLSSCTYATEFDTLTNDSDIFTFEEGYYASSSGKTALSGYTLYSFTAQKDFEFYVDSVNATAFSIGIYNGGITAAGYDHQYRMVDNNLPTVNNKALISIGQIIAISVYTGAGSVGTFSVKADYSYWLLNNAVRLNEGQLEQSIYKIAGPTTFEYTKDSDVFTKYSSEGYINNDTGLFQSLTGYQCYYFTTDSAAQLWFDLSKVSTWCQVAVYNGTIFSSSAVEFIGSLGRNTLPTSANKLSVASGRIIVVCVNTSVDFSMSYLAAGNIYLNDKQIDYIKTKTGISSPIVVKPGTSTQFVVSVLDESTNKYIDHVFEKQYNVADGVTTASVWYESVIKDDGNTIAQGNTNFIFYLPETGHTGHVGAGHGCAVAVWTKFFADGKVIDPTALTEKVECSAFRMTEKVNHYLRDDSKGTWDNSIPVIVDGSPVIVGIQYLDAEWTVNNRVKIRNRLDIVRNSVTFVQCHAAMCCGFYPYFDNIIINNGEYVWNKFTTNDGGTTFTATNEGGTNTVLTIGGTTALTGDEVIEWGDKYRICQSIVHVNPSRYGKSNILVQSPPYSDNRIKAYLMPCVCTQSSQSVAEGQTVETFNSGDRLEVWAFRELDISE